MNQLGSSALATILLLAIAGGACVSSQAILPSSAHSDEALAGCYRLRPGPWHSDTTLLSRFDVRLVSTHFRLSRERFTRDNDFLVDQDDSLPRYVVDDESPEVGKVFGLLTNWQRVRLRPDTIVLNPRPSHTIVRLHLAPKTSGSLEGRIYAFKPGSARSDSTSENQGR